MAIDQFQVLQDHLDSGFRILKYERKFGNFLFSIWEFGQPFIISVEDGANVAKFIESGEYRKYLLEEVTRCIVLFDIVGFSKLENQQQLQKIIRLQCFLNDHRLKNYDIAEKVSLGDGAIISFSEAHKLKALDFVRDLSGFINAFNNNSKTEDKHLQLRTGINYGKVHRFTDINKIANLIGDGVNRAERVTSLGDAGHVLCTESVSTMHFEAKTKYSDLFFDCGEYLDKHDIPFHVHNICGKIDGVNLGISRPPKKK